MKGEIAQKSLANGMSLVPCVNTEYSTKKWEPSLLDLKQNWEKEKDVTEITELCSKNSDSPIKLPALSKDLLDQNPFRFAEIACLHLELSFLAANQYQSITDSCFAIAVIDKKKCGEGEKSERIVILTAAGADTGHARAGFPGEKAFSKALSNQEVITYFEKLRKEFLKEESEVEVKVEKDEIEKIEVENVEIEIEVEKDEKSEVEKSKVEKGGLISRPNFNEVTGPTCGLKGYDHHHDAEMKAVRYVQFLRAQNDSDCSELVAISPTKGCCAGCHIYARDNNLLERIPKNKHRYNTYQTWSKVDWNNKRRRWIEVDWKTGQHHLIECNLSTGEVVDLGTPNNEDSRVHNSMLESYEKVGDWRKATRSKNQELLKELKENHQRTIKKDKEKYKASGKEEIKDTKDEIVNTEVEMTEGFIETVKVENKETTQNLNQTPKDYFG